MGVGTILKRIEKRQTEENEFFNDSPSNLLGIKPEERCDTNEVVKRDVDPTEQSHRRKKRATIAWPARSKFTAELYYAIPLISPPQITIPVAFGVPFTFDIPNSTYALKFKKRSIEDRYNIYGAIEGIFHGLGYDGRSCIQRAICERAEHHFLTNGILSELVNLILAVSSAAQDGVMLDYIDAEKQGKYQGNCQEKYSSCPFSIFKLIGN